MLCEQILGTLSDEQFKNLKVDYVDIEWHEAFKKLHRKTSQSGIEVGIKLDNDILTRGLRQGDVLAINEDNVIAVNIPKDKALVAGHEARFERGARSVRGVDRCAEREARREKRHRPDDRRPDNRRAGWFSKG